MPEDKKKRGKEGVCQPAHGIDTLPPWDWNPLAQERDGEPPAAPEVPTWGTKRPTHAGWWWRLTHKWKYAVPVEVWERKGKLYAKREDGSPQEIDAYSDQYYSWSGPIAVPIEDKASPIRTDAYLYGPKGALRKPRNK